MSTTTPGKTEVTTEPQVDVQFAPDPALEGSGALLSDMGLGAVRRIVAANGWEVDSSKPVQLLYRPGRYLRIRHSVWAGREGINRRFSVTTDLQRRPIASVPEVPASVSLPVAFTMEGPRWRTWVFPFDPELPGLSDVLSIDGARAIAEPLFGAPCSVRSNIVRYRPTSRAVVRYEVRPRGRTDGTPMVLYVKVLPSQSADAIMLAASTMAAAGDLFVLPIARPAPDILVYAERAGTTLRDALTAPTPVPTPTPASILGVLDVLAELPDPGTRGPSSPERRLERTVELLMATRPERAAAIAELGEAIKDGLGRHPVDTRVVHGDFYEGQLLIDGEGAITGVLDVDDIGPGDPVMDIANYTAHLSSLAESHPESSARLLAHQRSIRALYLERSGVPTGALAAREAVVGLGMATGPLRVLSENWPDRVDARIGIAARSLGMELG
jgi:hypothetical protein